MVFGPGHDNARAAAELLGVGGGATVRTADALADIVLRWLDDPAARRAAGSSARDWILLHQGAAARTATKLVEGLSDQRPPDTGSSVDGAARTAI
jgi:3-deoxy-D-manno-octulosonic-acid transferase